MQEEPKSGGGLLLENDKETKTPAEKAHDWYSQDIFKEFAGLVDPENIPQAKRRKTSNEDSSDSSDDEVMENSVKVYQKKTEKKVLRSEDEPSDSANVSLHSLW